MLKLKWCQSMEGCFTSMPVFRKVALNFYVLIYIYICTYIHGQYESNNSNAYISIPACINIIMHLVVASCNNYCIKDVCTHLASY